MGNKTGKLVLKPIPQDESRTETSPTTETTQPGAQLANGDAPVCIDVPPIDGVTEPISERSAEAMVVQAESEQPVHCEPPTETTAVKDDAPVVNGDVNASDVPTPSGKSKKLKNPIVWLQRRLSKSATPKKDKNAASENNTTIEDQTKTEGNTPEQDNETTKLAGVAEDLVEEVITSVVTADEQPTEETKLAKPTEKEETHIVEMAVKCHRVESEIVENCNQVVKNGDSQSNINQQSIVEVADANNTNAEEDTFNSEIPTTKLLHQDPIIEKMPELELINGHAESGSECNGHALNGSTDA